MVATHGKNQNESFGKKIPKTRKRTSKSASVTSKTKRTATRTTGTRSAIGKINSEASKIELPPQHDDSDSSSTTSSTEVNNQGSSSQINFQNAMTKPSDTNGANNLSRKNDICLVIPIMGDFLDDDDDDIGEISLEDAHSYPIGGNGIGKKRQLRLPPRKKSPLTVKLEKARKEVDDYIKTHHEYDWKKLPLKDQVLLMDTDVEIRANILKKFEDIDKTKSSYDSTKFTNWVKDVLKLPFGKNIPLPITLDSGPERILEYLTTVRGTLNKAIAGQETAKEEVVDFIARLISNPKSKGNILALSGGPGVGKTRLVRKGIAEALGRPFHVINLGGMNDVHVLTGHDLTYTGAKYGRFASILIQSQCENPVIYLDEIDKIQSSHDKGMEIFRVLTHVLDEEQNHQFYDEYFSNVALDLSKVLFVASLNSAESIENILRDRLKLIPVKDLDLETKVNISRNYILPELCEQVAMPVEILTISDEVVKYIIKNKTEEEGGCRKLKRKWETIIQKLNTHRITKSGPFKDTETIILSESLVDELLKQSEAENDRFPSHIYN